MEKSLAFSGLVLRMDILRGRKDDAFYDSAMIKIIYAGTVSTQGKRQTFNYRNSSSTALLDSGFVLSKRSGSLIREEP